MNSILTQTIDQQGRRRDWVAREAGISATLLSKIERGTRSATPPVQERLARVLGIPIDVLFPKASDAA